MEITMQERKKLTMIKAQVYLKSGKAKKSGERTASCRWPLLRSEGARWTEVGTHAVMQQWIPACAGMTEREDSHTRSAGQDEPAPRIHSLPGPAGWDCQKGNRRSSRNVSATRILV